MRSHRNNQYIGVLYEGGAEMVFKSGECVPGTSQEHKVQLVVVCKTIMCSFYSWVPLSDFSSNWNVLIRSLCPPQDEWLHWGPTTARPPSIFTRRASPQPLGSHPTPYWGSRQVPNSLNRIQSTSFSTVIYSEGSFFDLTFLVVHRYFPDPLHSFYHLVQPRSLLISSLLHDTPFVPHCWLIH